MNYFDLNQQHIFSPVIWSRSRKNCLSVPDLHWCLLYMVCIHRILLSFEIKMDEHILICLNELVIAFGAFGCICIFVVIQNFYLYLFNRWVNLDGLLKTAIIINHRGIWMVGILLMYPLNWHNIWDWLLHFDCGWMKILTPKSVRWCCFFQIIIFFWCAFTLTDFISSFVGSDNTIARVCWYH